MRKVGGSLNQVLTVNEKGEYVDTAPARNAVAVTPADVGTIPATRGLYVGVSGDVKVVMSSLETVTFVGLAAGVVHPLSVVRVFNTGTTATNIVALY